MSTRELAYAAARQWMPDSEPDSMKLIALTVIIENAIRESRKDLIEALGEACDWVETGSEIIEGELGDIDGDCKEARERIAAWRALIPKEKCNQCGAERQEWQPKEETRCPNHANPLGSCDGVLRAE